MIGLMIIVSWKSPCWTSTRNCRGILWVTLTFKLLQRIIHIMHCNINNTDGFWVDWSKNWVPIALLPQNINYQNEGPNFQPIFKHWPPVKNWNDLSGQKLPHMFHMSVLLGTVPLKTPSLLAFSYEVQLYIILVGDKNYDFQAVVFLQRYFEFQKA